MGFLDMAFNTKKAEGANPEVAEFERRLGTLEQDKKAVMYQVGELYVSQNDVISAAGTAFEPLMQKISEIEKEAEVLEKRILSVQGLRKCEKCGNVLPLESAFCNKCGEKLEALFEQEEVSKQVCRNCGATLVDGAAFCTSCGTKVGE